MLVSVILPTYNNISTIERSIKSVINQTHRDLELIICDDNSTDNTLDLILQYSKKDDRIRILRNQSNEGAGFCRAKAISAAKGEYCAFIDADDEWDCLKLEKQVDFMNSGNIDISHTDIMVVDGKNMTRKKVPEVISFSDMHRKNFIATSSAMIRRKAINFNFQNLRKRQDYVFWLQNMKCGASAHGLNEPLSTYHVRAGSLSQSHRIFLPYYNYLVFRKYLKYSAAQSVIFVLNNIWNRKR